MRPLRESIGKLLLIGIACSWTAPTFAQQNSAAAQLPVLMARFQKEVQAEEFQKASDTAKELIPVGEQLLGKNNPDVATMRVMRGNFLRDLGKYDEAQQVLRETLQVMQKRFGARHTLTATTLNALGSCLLYTSDAADE